MGYDMAQNNYDTLLSAMSIVTNCEVLTKACFACGHRTVQLTTNK